MTNLISIESNVNEVITHSCMVLMTICELFQSCFALEIIVEKSTAQSMHYNTTVLSLCALPSPACMLVDVSLQLFHTNIFNSSRLICAPPHFNVIAHFLAQYGSEPWTTTITASAPTYTPL